MKFQKPDRRESLVIDYGFRCHLTAFTRTTATAPSAFVTKLRKALRSRRVTAVSQVGIDRILDFEISDGQYHLFLEFYAGGNIILTDAELLVLALLRIVPQSNDLEELRVGLKYSLENKQNYHRAPPIDLDRLRKGLESFRSKSTEQPSAKKSKKKNDDPVQRALANVFPEFPPILIEHALKLSDFHAESLDAVLGNEQVLRSLVPALKNARAISESLLSQDECKGFIMAKRRDQSAESSQMVSVEEARENLIYEDFHPFLPGQMKDNPNFHIVEISGFNKTVDEFYSSVESQKLESRISEKEAHAKRKLETAKQDHEKRLDGLQQTQELNVRRAQAIEGNLERVLEATSAVNSLVAQGMGWPEIARMIEQEQARGNPVATMIKLPLKLYENTVTLLLAEGSYEDEPDFEGEETDSDADSGYEDDGSHVEKEKGKSQGNALAVDIDLALTPWSNARQYYDQKRNAADKEIRTLQASAKALKSTEKKINTDLKKELKQEKDLMRPQRQALWFEKFLYFLSSEGYLVLGSKDLQQNEILYNRHLKKGDVFVHADLPGASVLVVKNKPGRSTDPIPPSTLSQAGSLSVSTSSAWDSKAVMSAWWVPAEQVSKTAPTGDYLPTGTFQTTGDKNFLPPAQLLLGFGIIFRVSEESKAKHFKHRVAEDRAGQESPPDKDGELVHAEITTEEIITTEHDEVEDSILENEADAPPSKTKDELDSASSENESDPETTFNPLQSYEEIDSQHRLVAIPEESPKESDVQDEIDDPQIQDDSADKDLESVLSKDDEGNTRVRHLSTKERRLRRHDNQNLDVNSPDESAQESEKPSNLIEKQPLAPKDRQVRGKQGKRQKLKNKYADQDDEDRALAMRLLGSAAAQEKAKETAATKASKEEELAAAKARRRKQHEIAEEKGRKAEEMRRLHFEEGAGEAEDEESLQQQVDLDCFVGTPLPGDEIVDALIVCGPWDAIGRKCKWRVKIQPGAVKKGKAVKEILASWNSTIALQEKKTRPPPPSSSSAAAAAAAAAAGAGAGARGDRVDQTEIAAEEQLKKREAELIKGFKDTEVIGLLPVGKVRLVLGGAGSGGGGGGGGGDTKGKGKGKGPSAGNQNKRGGKGSKKK